MGLIKLQFKPGINRDQTDYSNEGGWRACDKIRFRSGFPQKIGGWTKYVPTSFLGTCRQLWNWVTSYSDNLLAIGTNIKVYIEYAGQFYGITPYETSLATPNTDNSINTTNTTTTVTVTLGAAHNAETGQYVQIGGVVGGGDVIGGIPITEINGNHTITVINSTAFSFVSTTTATSTVAAAGGTAITMGFEIFPGYAITTYGFGWGTGTWSRGMWGLGSSTPVELLQRDWWFDNFDNDLVMNIRNGAGYWWARGTTDDPAGALETHAVSLSSFATSEGYDANAVPVKIMQLLVSQQDKHLLAFGAVPFGSTSEADFDPLLIRWADQDNPGQWTPTTTNTAGDIRVSRGSGILRALPTRQEILVWTDTSLYSLQFLGTTDVFGLQEYDSNISLISSRAVAYAGNTAYWMGRDKFYAYTGRVETLPCTLRDHIFNDINLSQNESIICSTNEEWNEIIWFYPSASSDYNDKYVIYNHLERIWYYGSLARTAWLDTSMREFPQACNTTGGTDTGYLYNHEDGVDDDGSGMSCYIESSDWDIGDGDKLQLIQRLIPDIAFHGTEMENCEVEMQLRGRYFPGGSATSDAEDIGTVVHTASLDEYTQQIFVRMRARQISINVSSSMEGVNWQLGSPRIQAREDGRR